LHSVRNKPANLLGVASAKVDRAAWKTRAQESANEMRSCLAGLRGEATDPLKIGIKPLYFLFDPGRAIVASDDVPSGSQEAKQMTQCRGEDLAVTYVQMCREKTSN